MMLPPEYRLRSSVIFPSIYCWVQVRDFYIFMLPFDRPPEKKSERHSNKALLPPPGTISLTHTNYSVTPWPHTHVILPMCTNEGIKPSSRVTAPVVVLPPPAPSLPLLRPSAPAPLRPCKNSFDDDDRSYSCFWHQRCRQRQRRYFGRHICCDDHHRYVTIFGS